MRISVTPIDIRDGNNNILYSFKIIVPVLTVEEAYAVNDSYVAGQPTFPSRFRRYIVMANNGVISNFGSWILNDTYRAYSHLPYYINTKDVSAPLIRNTGGFMIDIGDFVNSIPDSDFYSESSVWDRSPSYKLTSGSYDPGNLGTFWIRKSKDGTYRGLRFYNTLDHFCGIMYTDPQQTHSLTGDYVYAAAFYLVETDGDIVGWIVENILPGYIATDPPYGVHFNSGSAFLSTLRTTTSRSDEIIPAIVYNSDSRKIQSDDPYDDGGHSEPGGGWGTGTFDLSSDTIGLPPLPTLSFASTGFTRIYNPSLSELNALANYLWTDQTFLDTVINHLKQLLENPMDAVISLSLLPCSIPNGTPEAVKVMYINTGVTMAPATTQFVDVDCGTYSLEEFYGSALDYNPYTKVHCYLPYIGQVTLDTDEVMGKTLNVVYRIDIVTGMCAAMILVDQNVLYQFSGHCSINMPINSADFSGYIGAAMTAGKMVAGVVAGASGNIPLAAELIGAPAPHSSTSETTEKTTERNPKTGRQITSGTSTRTTTTNTPGASFGEMSRKAAANTVGAVMGSKLTVEHAGGFTGNSGYLAVRRPYLIIERPRMCNPEEYGKYNGRPSMIYMNLGDCSGYTEVQSIQFDGISATNPELAELSELLKSGVLF